MICQSLRRISMWERRKSTRVKSDERHVTPSYDHYNKRRTKNVERRIKILNDFLRHLKP